MSLGMVRIEAKADFRAGKRTPHSGKRIFIPAGTHVILGRTGIEFNLTKGSNGGVFKFCALPKNELIAEKQLQLGDSVACDFHPYWITLSVKEAEEFCRNRSPTSILSHEPSTANERKDQELHARLDHTAPQAAHEKQSTV
jgi:hypothetical protein